MQSPNHPNRERTLAIEHLRDTGTITKQRLQILARQSLLFHSKSDGVNRVWTINRLMLRFVNVNQGSKHIKAIAIGRTRLGTPETLYLCDCR